MESSGSIAWHCVDFPEVLERAGTHAQGLTAHEAARRLARDGPNRLEATASAGWLRRLLSQFRDVLVMVLLAAGAVVLALGHVTDAAVIFAVIVLNALIGFVQEARAERALGAIRAMLAPVAVAIRDGRRLTLDAATLVRGDLVWLEAGERV
ncbi:MAG: cation-transporting P-type ATPase, partial [Betaproteobacteria bacterium]